MEGHPGHRGNVLAHALVAKLQRLLSALARAERSFIDSGKRQTEYEVSRASKTNPTEMTLRPVPRIKNYDPLPAFNWTIEQIEHIATGRDVDERLDPTFAQALADIAEKKRDDDYTRLWISGNGLTLTLDENFRVRSQAVAVRLIERRRPEHWFEGVSHGSVVGNLRQVADIEGEHQFVILPPVGADRIQCTFPEDKREKMREYLFKTVRVVGRLHYVEDSPFPVHVEMEDIELASPTEDPPHLLDLRGAFKGRRRGRSDLEQLLDGL
jgi:hypothetical protein